MGSSGDGSVVTCGGVLKVLMVRMVNVCRCGVVHFDGRQPPCYVDLVFPFRVYRARKFCTMLPQSGALEALRTVTIAT